MVEVDRVCGSPSCSKTGKHLCSGCGEEIYCSKECQKSHWPSHKLACKTAVKPEAAAFLKSFDDLSIKQLKNILKVKAASFDKKKKDKVLASLDAISEKQDLVKLVQEHVQMTEVESLLSASPASGSSSSATSSSSLNKPKKSSSKPSGMPTPTPAQLKQQAKLMRENPGMVRKAQAAFANMTDEQIRQYADQLELAAADPNMMKEVERMSKLSEKERGDLQFIQEGLSGMKPMDLPWMDKTIAVLKKNADLFKTMMKGKGAMLGGVTDDQVDSFIDYAASMDAGTLKLILRALVYLGSLYRPAVDLYAKVDSYTFGMARYILLAIVLFVAYWISVPIWFVLKFVLLQLYALIMLLVNAVSGGKGSAASSVPLNAGTSAFKNSVKAAVDTVAAGLGAAGVAKVASSVASGATSAGGSAAVTPESSGESGATGDENYDF